MMEENSSCVESLLENDPQVMEEAVNLLLKVKKGREIDLAFTINIIVLNFSCVVLPSEIIFRLVL